jgi:hypothetical protein
MDRHEGLLVRAGWRPMYGRRPSELSDARTKIVIWHEPSQTCAWNTACWHRPDMPSFAHELLVDLFRQRPALAVELLGASAGIRLGGATMELGSIDLSQVVPTEYRSDALTVLRDGAGEAVAAVVTEVQLGYDEAKRRTWPVYVTVARATYDCPVTLLVLAPDPAVARWAGQPIDLGHPGFVLRPVVIGYAQVPRVCDVATARAAPELAVLSAMAHGDLETAEAAEAGLDGLPEDKQRLYWDVILSSLPVALRQDLEVRMLEGYKYQSDFARKYYGLGREEGRTEGLRRAVLELVGARLPELRDELGARLQDRSEAELVKLVIELGTAHDEDRFRAVLDGTR